MGGGPGSNVGGPSVEYFGDDGKFPNSRLPLLLYRAALDPRDVTPEAMEVLFRGNGWPPAWRSSVFTYHHYHSTAHEVLGVVRGRARLLLGGPSGRTFEVAPGDVIVIPAGVVHQQLESSRDFLVVGGYPPGQSWDLPTGQASERPAADRNIAKVPIPLTDPVSGALDGLLDHWSGSGQTLQNS